MRVRAALAEGWLRLFRQLSRIRSFTPRQQVYQRTDDDVH